MIARYIAGGTVLLSLGTFVANEGWMKLDDAQGTAHEAIELAGNVDARQQKLEALYEQQSDYNRELLNLQRYDRGLPPLAQPQLTPTPGQISP